MSDIPKSQRAVIYTGSIEDGKLVEVKEIDTPLINENEMLIKSVAWAANPSDWKHIVFGWSEKGNITGSDVSGVIVKVGSNVKNFKVGDHVATMRRGGNRKVPDSGVFQEYARILPRTSIRFTTPLVEVTDEKEILAFRKVQTFESAAPIASALNSLAISFHHQLGLSFDKSKQSGKSILIWSGATATGLLAIQVARQMYGLNVIATASKKNHELLKRLGADATFDYHDSDVVAQIKKYAGDKLVYGLDTISNDESFNRTYQSLADNAPALIDNLLFLTEENIKGSKKSNVKFSGCTLGYLAEGGSQDMNGQVHESSPELLKDHAEFMEEAAKYVNNGKIQPPPLRLLKHGLYSVEEAFSLLRNDKVSGEKLVFRAKDSE